MQTEIPLSVGGRTARSLRRAVELGDGWAPFGLRTDDIAAMVASARGTDAWAARERPIDVLLQNDLTNPAYLGMKAAALGQTGRYDEAIACYEAILASHPDLPKAWTTSTTSLTSL